MPKESVTTGKHMIKSMNLGLGLAIAYCGFQHRLKKTTQKFVVDWSVCTCEKCLEKQNEAA